MTTRTGVLPRSPLIYALASVRFAPWPLFDKHIAEIQDQLRDTVPLINRIQLTQTNTNTPMGVAASNVQTAWMLMPSDKRFGIQLSEDQLLMISDNYVHYEEFASIFTQALDRLHTHMRFIDVANMVVRYVDHIKPRDNENIGLYINDRLLPPRIKDYENRSGHVFCEYTKDELNLRVNAVSIPGAPAVPQDLISVLVMLRASRSRQPLDLQALKSNELLLDMDAVYSPNGLTRMNSTEITARLGQLHSLANGFFRAHDVCTDHAFKVWKGEA